MSVNCCIRNVPLVLKQLTSNKFFVRSITLFNNRVPPPSLTYVRFMTNQTGIGKKNNNVDEVVQRIQVYQGILARQLKSVKIFSMVSSVVGIGIQPHLYNAIMMNGEVNLPVVISLYTVIGFFTLVTPILLHFVAKKYVTQLYYLPATGSYVANTLTLFCRNKETHFKPEDVKVPDVPGAFTTLIAKGTPLFLDPRMFPDPEHYIKIMGYDKPMDFKLATSPSEDKKGD